MYYALTKDQIDKIEKCYKNIFSEKPLFYSNYIIKSPKAHFRFGLFAQNSYLYIRIYFFTIKKKFRRQHLGSFFIKDFIEITKTINKIRFIELQAENKAAESFWLALGFESIITSEIYGSFLKYYY